MQLNLMKIFSAIVRDIFGPDSKSVWRKIRLLHIRSWAEPPKNELVPKKSRNPPEVLI